MNVGIDIRCLTSPHLTGVGQYTKGLLRSLFDIDKENNYYLFYNSHKDVSKFVPTFNNDNVKVCNTKYPNKLLNIFLILFFSRCSLINDRMVIAEKLSVRASSG